MKTGFNPFPGLRPFLPEESDLFFGREGQSSEVVERLNANKFVTVIGASGSGKSSLIFCGVIPLFRAGSGGVNNDCAVITMRPGNDPAGNMADALIESGLMETPGGESRDSLIDSIKDRKSVV